MAAPPGLPPGPSAPKTIQSIQWIVRPTAMMERCRRRYGDMFTLRVVHEGTWVFLADPDAVKQVFTGDPRLLHAGEANVVLLPFLGRNSVLLLDEQPHMAQRKLMLPSFHGERMRRYGQTMTEVTEREVAGWPRGPAPEGVAAHAGDHARGGDAHRVRRDRHHASPAVGGRPARGALLGIRSSAHGHDRGDGPAPAVARPRLPAGHGSRRRAALRGDPPAPRRPRPRGARRRALDADPGPRRGGAGQCRTRSCATSS